MKRSRRMARTCAKKADHFASNEREWPSQDETIYLLPGWRQERGGGVYVPMSEKIYGQLHTKDGSECELKVPEHVAIRVLSTRACLGVYVMQQ